MPDDIVEEEQQDGRFASKNGLFGDDCSHVLTKTESCEGEL